MSTQTLNPLAQTAQILALAELRYLPGFPRSYRFDAKKGILNFNGEKDLTQKGQAFSLVPLAFRIFTDEILGFTRRRWAELFFVNEGGQVCSLLFHSYSVEQLQRALGELYYDDASLTDVRLTVLPEPRQNAYGSYYVATFRCEALPAAERAQLAALADSLPPLYRQETLTGDAWLHISKNFEAPGEDCPPHQAGELPGATPALMEEAQTAEA